MVFKVLQVLSCVGLASITHAQEKIPLPPRYQGLSVNCDVRFAGRPSLIALCSGTGGSRLRRELADGDFDDYVQNVDPLGPTEAEAMAAPRFATTDMLSGGPLIATPEFPEQWAQSTGSFTAGSNGDFYTIKGYNRGTNDFDGDNIGLFVFRDKQQENCVLQPSLYLFQRFHGNVIEDVVGNPSLELDFIFNASIPDDPRFDGSTCCGTDKILITFVTPADDSEWIVQVKDGAPCNGAIGDPGTADVSYTLYCQILTADETQVFPCELERISEE